MTERATTPADTIRRAAALMRYRVVFATPGPWRVWTDPGLVGVAPPRWVGPDRRTVVAEAHWCSADAEHIAGADPTVMALIADQWDATATDMDALHALERPDGIADWSGQTHAAWTKTLTAARAYLATDETGA